ncbi:MAG: hypothetical protein KDK36_14750 [Leptospiraceae bacterium]|nr:hypothetical protein [Leptospiraceae bacterium]
MKAIIYLLIYLSIFSNSIISQAQEDSKPLLRVFPIFRYEECDWAIRMDICHRCLSIGERYAQRIIFYKDKPYREHGCYTDSKGFHLLEIYSEAETAPE